MHRNEQHFPAPGSPWAVNFRGAVRPAIAARNREWIIYIAETDRVVEETLPNRALIAPLTPERPIFLPAAPLDD